MSEEKDKALESLYPAAQADISMPNIMMPVPSKESRKVSEVKDECGGAFKYAFLGAGQGGSRIAESFYKLGYRRVAVINTAQQDLNSIELENKLCIGEGGAGKDPEVAERAYEEKTSAAIMLLLSFLIIFNLFAVLIRRKFETKW